MTTKQIANSVGKDERTIQRWAKKTGDNLSSIGDKISSVQKLGIPADYNLDETIAIIEAGMGKNAASIFRQNATAGQIPQAKLSSTDSRLDRLESIIERLATMFATALPQLIEKRQAAIEAPPLPLRAQLRQIVAKAGHTEGNYREVWNRLYNEALYRLNTNLKLCAENRRIDTLDYAEQEGYLPELVAIAREIFAA